MVIQNINILDDSSQHMTPLPTIRANKHVLSNEMPDYEKLRLYVSWVNVDTVQKTIEQSTQWGVSILHMFLMKKHLKSRNPALNIMDRSQNYTFHFICITFHLHYI